MKNNELKQLLERIKIYYENSEVEKSKIYDLISILNESGIEDLERLGDLIEHEPKVGGFLGITEREYEIYINRIKEILNKYLA